MNDTDLNDIFFYNTNQNDNVKKHIKIKKHEMLHKNIKNIENKNVNNYPQYNNIDNNTEMASIAKNTFLPFFDEKQPVDKKTIPPSGKVTEPPIKDTIAKNTDTIIFDIKKISEEKVSDVFEFDELIVNLKLLSQLKKDEKLLNNNGSLDIDNRFIQMIRRLYSGDGRDVTFNILKKINMSANFHSEKFINSLKLKYDRDVEHNLQIMTRDLITAKIGYRNLLITYRDDESFLSKLDLCLDGLIVRINKNLNYNA